MKQLPSWIICNLNGAEFFVRSNNLPESQESPMYVFYGTRSSTTVFTRWSHLFLWWNTKTRSHFQSYSFEIYFIIIFSSTPKSSTSFLLCLFIPNPSSFLIYVIPFLIWVLSIPQTIFIEDRTWFWCDNCTRRERKPYYFSWSCILLSVRVAL
jgi:hypothetical protein